MRCHCCDTSLITMRVDGLVGHACRRCRGVVVLAPVLRRSLPRERHAALWRRISRSNLGSGYLCPSCRHRMRTVYVPVEGHPRVQLDGCRACQLVWFDAGELDDLMPEGMAPRDGERPKGARGFRGPKYDDLLYHEPLVTGDTWTSDDPPSLFHVFLETIAILIDTAFADDDAPM